MTEPYWCQHCALPVPARPHHDCQVAPDGPFADALADGLDVADAAVRTGYHPKHGYRVLARIRAGLGWQAA